MTGEHMALRNQGAARRFLIITGATNVHKDLQDTYHLVPSHMLLSVGI
jgi:hypothetical protein